MPKSDTQWKKGQSGNPKGRPKANVALADLIRERGGKRINRIIDKILDMAEAGDVTAIKEVLDRMYGKPTQHNINEGGDKTIIQVCAPKEGKRRRSTQQRNVVQDSVENLNSDA